MKLIEWEDIEGYNGVYKINVNGEIKSTSRKNRAGNTMYSDIILKQHPIGRRRNYLSVTLTNSNGERKQYKVHRLVATQFIPNPKKLPQVNHIDGNTFNNAISNLEWVNNSENQLHAWKNGLNYRSENGTDPREGTFIGVVKCSRPVVKFDSNYEVVDIYSSVEKAIESVGNSSINKSCQLKTHSSSGFRWRYLSDCTLKNKIIVVCGESSSGKNKVVEILLENNKNLSRVVSYTTRPIRENEVDGTDYYFVCENTLKKKALEGELLNIKQYNTEYGKWIYALSVNEILKNNPIVIVDPKGLIELERKVGRQNIVSIKIEADYEIRLERAKKRDTIDDSKMSEIKRRFISDANDFDGLNIFNFEFKNNSKDDLRNTVVAVSELIKANKDVNNGKIAHPLFFKEGELYVNGKYFNNFKQVVEHYNLNYSKVSYYKSKGKSLSEIIYIISKGNILIDILPLD